MQYWITSCPCVSKAQSTYVPENVRVVFDAVVLSESSTVQMSSDEDEDTSSPPFIDTCAHAAHTIETRLH